MIEMPMTGLTLQTDDPASPEVRKLIEELDRYHQSLYPAESNHLLSVAALREPNVAFITARLNGRFAGCGAFVNRDSAYAEIKRMFVLPEFRGRKIGRRLLDELEARARAAGLKHARLETGIYQLEALQCYQKAGYERCGPFGEYKPDPLSVFMHKVLE
jgi:putative acetyltransferase